MKTHMTTIAIKFVTYYFQLEIKFNDYEKKVNRLVFIFIHHGKNLLCLLK